MNRAAKAGGCVCVCGGRFAAVPGALATGKQKGHGGRQEKRKRRFESKQFHNYYHLHFGPGSSGAGYYDMEKITSE
jgi:hypothetical protein